LDIDERIKAFEAKLREKGPQQQTKEWYKTADETIGCSQLGALFGMNKHMSVKDLADRFALIRLGKPPPFEGGAPCGWGIAFEPAVIEFINKRLGSKVLCRNTCITDIPGIQRLRCSPDGIMKVYRTKDDILWTTSMDPDAKAKAECVLVEIKCPLLRWPKPTIPPQYKPQVLGGLIATEELTHRGLFIDAVFKICTREQLGEEPGYNTAFHKDSKWMQSRYPLAWGEIQVLEKRCSKRGDVIDYGVAENDVIEKMLDAVSKRDLSTLLVNITFANNRGKIDFHRRDMECIGIISWKLMDTNFLTVERSPPFREELINKITEFFKRVDLFSYTGESS